jgi:hypothetical protein
MLHRLAFLGIGITKLLLVLDRHAAGCLFKTADKASFTHREFFSKIFNRYLLINICFDEMQSTNNRGVPC